METRFCVECRAFIDSNLFITRSRRTLCRAHTNKLARQVRLKKWDQDPLVRKTHEIWQIAYVDSLRTFKTAIDMKQSDLLELLQSLNINISDAVRLVPVDPTKPVSIDNYCFTSVINKNDMCRIWRKLHSANDYMLFLDPKTKRPVYGSSMKHDYCLSIENATVHETLHFRHR